MRLLFVIDSFGSGGAQRQMVQLAIALVAAGHHVEFFVYAPRHDHFRGAVTATGITVHEHEKRSRHSPRVIFELARVMRVGKFDVVLGYLTTPSIYAELASLLNRPRGHRTPVVASERGPLWRVGLRLRLLLGVHHLASQVVTNSWNNRAQLLSLWPSLGPRSSVILNGIDLELFSPAGSRPAPRPGRLDVLAIGTVLPAKDPMVLVEALAIFRQRAGWTPHVRWVGKLASGGGDAMLEDAVRRRLAALDLEGSWTWMGERSDIPHLLRTHDVLAHPSILEGLPNAICEALATGLPVIAARIGDNERLIQTGVTGLLFTPGDADALCDRLLEFHRLPARSRDEMGMEARAFAVRALGLSHCVAEYEALFRRVSGRGSDMARQPPLAS